MAPAQAGTGANPARSAHTASSIRARSRHDPADPQRKTVYKPVLDNPLVVQWPPLPAPVRKAILDELLALLDSAKSGNGKGIAEWRLDEHTRRKNAAKAVNGKGKAFKGKGKERADATLTGSEVERTKDAGASPRETHVLTTRSSSTYAIPTSTTHASSSASTSSASAITSDCAPPILDNLVIGINEVTRALESRMRWERWELGDDSAAPPASSRRRDGAVEADELEQSGRRRRHKSKAEKDGGENAVPSALPSSDSRFAAPPTLGDHPAYGFVGNAGRRLAEKEVKPDYLIKGRAKGEWRLLVNSEMRRLRSPVASSSTRSPSHETRTEASPGPASSALLASQPAQPTDSVLPLLDEACSSSAPPTVPLIDLIFVCRPDINPPSLVAHLPTMVAAANGIHEALDSVLSASDPAKEAMVVEKDGQRRAERPEMRKVLLVPLDIGAERRLADKLGLRRVAAIGLSSLLPSAASLFALLSSTPSLTTLSAPWLVPHLLYPASSASPAKSLYQPTTIKHLKTSAPLNPRAEVTRRKEEKRKNKEERKERRKKRRVGEGEGEGLYVAED